MCPIDSKDFEKKGKRPKRKKIQINILKILAANPTQALSSKELEEILGVIRQEVHQGLRALDEKGFVERGAVRDSRTVYYATITEAGLKYVRGKTGEGTSG